MSTTEAVVIKVGIADVKIARFPDTIRTSGLGSCVGLVLYDKEKANGGSCSCHAAGFDVIENCRA